MTVSRRPHLFVTVTADISCRFYWGMLQYLKESGFTTTMASSPGKLLDEVADSQDAMSVAIPMEREIRPFHDLVSLWRLYRSIRATHPDVVDVSTPKAGFLGGIAALLARVPCRVYTLRGLRLETTAGLKRRILWLAEWVACACSHRVVPVSESLRLRAIQLHLVRPEKACSLGNGSTGVDTEYFNPSNKNTKEVAALRQAFGLTGNETVIGFVGRLVKDKGIRELVEAFRKLSGLRGDLRLLLVGDFETGDPIDNEVRQYIESTATVLRPGFVADTAPFYALMDLFVLPTYREGFPGVCLEAQASEVPVITTNATGAVDSVQHGITGLIVPVKDTGALQHALETLLSNPRLRTEMGRAGRKWMQNTFCREVIWQAHVEVYRALLTGGSKRRQQSCEELCKRLFDLFVAATLLILLSPAIALLTLLIWITMGRPIFYRQIRPGFRSKPFSLAKFRTMREAYDSSGLPLPDAERLTRFGEYLRKLSLDELPQLWNVVRDDMSLVGPRPLLMEYLPRYTPEQARRHDVKPGITGWAQINGRNGASWEQKFACDLWYVDHQSLALDLKIIALTILKALKREGISQPGHVTMPEFTGWAAQGKSQ
jgi:lipopolysaccharide/colanic/teichoic acid biosynthesis glycosyltransferase